MASPEQNDYSGPLPSMDPNADPNGFMAPGNALLALDPNDPNADQQPVGSAMDAVAGQEEEPYDAIPAKLASGGSIRITSQAQFNALSESQKAVVRAGVATGGKLRAGDALRVYQDTLKQARATQVQTVPLPDGRTVYFANGQRIEADKQPEPVKMERYQAEDGTIVLTDPTTGRSFPAWDEKTGEPMRGQAKLSATQEDNIKRLQMQSENLGARLDALTSFTESDKVEYDTQSGNYAAAPWMGTKVKALRTQLEKEKSDYDKRIEISLRPVRRSNAEESQASQPTATPSPTPAPTRSAAPQPTPTPTPNPMPTPDEFIVGRNYTDAKGNKAKYLGNGVFK